ncbi:MAG: HAD hydrolase-like protein [Clostridia bacterium]|nr:HAD hydrolase-like protein [Clostridia bacterium]
MKKHIFFDVGGVLFETETAISSALSYAAEQTGFVTPKDLSLFFGVPAPDAVIDAFGVGLADATAIISAYRDYFSKEAVYACSLYEGTIELLDALTAKGAKLYAISSMLHGSLLKLLEYHRLDTYFTDARGVSADNTVSSKEDVLRYAMQKTGLITKKSGRLGAIKKEIVFVGDRWQDKLAAKLLQVDFVGTSYGYGTENELSDSIKASSPKELEKILLSL